MTVIVKYDRDGNPRYQSAKGVGSTEADRSRARELDLLLKRELAGLRSRLYKTGALKQKGKGNVDLYWELGNTMRKIYFQSGLIDASEKYLYFLNSRLYVPEELRAKDRGPNRMHLEYCFRLAGFPKVKAMKMNWGEWVYLFDSPGINREHRFEDWLSVKMDAEADALTRENVRLFAQCTNAFLGKIETRDLSHEQLWRCYDCAWLVSMTIRRKGNIADNSGLRELLLRNHARLGEVVDGSLTPTAFAETFG